MREAYPSPRQDASHFGLLELLQWKASEKASPRSPVPLGARMVSNPPAIGIQTLRLLGNQHEEIVLKIVSRNLELWEFVIALSRTAGSWSQAGVMLTRGIQQY